MPYVPDVTPLPLDEAIQLLRLNTPVIGTLAMESGAFDGADKKETRLFFDSLKSNHTIKKLILNKNLMNELLIRNVCKTLDDNSTLMAVEFDKSATSLTTRMSLQEKLIQNRNRAYNRKVLRAPMPGNYIKQRRLRAKGINDHALDMAIFAITANNAVKLSWYLSEYPSIRRMISEGFSLLGYAASLGQLDCVKIITSFDRIQAIFYKDYTHALSHAVESDYYDVVNYLLTVAGPLAGNSKERLDIHSCFPFTKSPDVAVLLIKHGADVNACNSEGDTLLHRLVKTANIPVCQFSTILVLLCQQNVDLLAKNGAGLTVSEYDSPYLGLLEDAIRQTATASGRLSIYSQHSLNRPGPFFQMLKKSAKEKLHLSRETCDNTL